jgi:DNA-directed RNA polymerase subunit RPC12/RpoP
MVVKVIDPGPDKSVVKQVVCSNCGAKLEYVPNDVKTSVHHDYGGGSDTYSHIQCPQCNKSVTVR